MVVPVFVAFGNVNPFFSRRAFLQILFGLCFYYNDIAKIESLDCKINFCYYLLQLSKEKPGAGISGHNTEAIIKKLIFFEK